MKQKILIDVRSPIEFESEHIKDSINIPLEEFIKNKSEVSKIKKEIILICRSGNRAKNACTHLPKDKAIILEGGIMNCKNKGYTTIKGDKDKQKWDIERQVRFVAGAITLTGIILGYTISPNFFLLSGFIGLGLVFASLTNSCMMGAMLMKLPYNKSSKKVNYKKLIEKINKN